MEFFFCLMSQACGHHPTHAAVWESLGGSDWHSSMKHTHLMAHLRQNLWPNTTGTHASKSHPGRWPHFNNNTTINEERERKSPKAHNKLTNHTLMFADSSAAAEQNVFVFY